MQSHFCFDCSMKSDLNKIFTELHCVKSNSHFPLTIPIQPISMIHHSKCFLLLKAVFAFGICDIVLFWLLFILHDFFCSVSFLTIYPSTWSLHFGVFLSAHSFMFLYSLSFSLHLRASCLLGRCSATWAMPLVLLLFFFFPGRLLCFGPGQPQTSVSLPLPP
jgi:hypothetical protein